MNKGFRSRISQAQTKAVSICTKKFTVVGLGYAKSYGEVAFHFL